MTSLYHNDIIALARAAINTGVLPNAPTAKQTNPWCGDECQISASFNGGGIVKSLHQTRGCILTLAAAAKATTMAMQLCDTGRVLQLTETFDKMMRGEMPLTDDLALFAPVIAVKNRRACVLLPFQTLAEVIRQHGVIR